ncbi:MAG TPA: NAD-dependent epimerase/dehydratase family protein [Patescibacteria group bacterium]
MANDSFQDKTVLVTGAAGFVGSHLVDALLAQGAKVIGVDNFITGRRKNIEHLLAGQSDSGSGFSFIEADVVNPPQEYLPAGTQPDFVLHFASPASPPGYQAKPIETYLVNSLATHNLLQYLLETHPEATFLFASTSEVYGDPQVHPQPEEYWGHVNPNGVRSCYDESKRLGETICGVHHRDFGLDTRIVRIFNTYGPRINPEDGRVIPQFIKESLAQQPLSLHGDGTQTRSYCYVSDLVEGILKMATTEGLAGETINLGNPDEHSIKETAEIIHQLINPDQELRLNVIPLPKDDPTRRKPNNSKAQRLLNWTPTVTFEEGLRRTIEHFKTQE